MPELPPASPFAVVVRPEKFHDPAPAPVMSRKSVCVTVTVAAVIVRAVPAVPE